MQLIEKTLRTVLFIHIFVKYSFCVAKYTILYSHFSLFMNLNSFVIFCEKLFCKIVDRIRVRILVEFKMLHSFVLCAII